MEGKLDFHYAMTLANTLYDIEFPDIEQAEEIALVAYNLIGNHHTALYKALIDVDPVTHKALLPCNVFRIESVTIPCVEDWEDTSNTEEYGNEASATVENHIENHKHFKQDPLYQRGKLVKYRQEGDALLIMEPYDKVSILYHGEILDNDGLPYLNDKEALAIAEYLSYIYKFKEGIRTNNQVATQISEVFKQQWLFHCDAARVPEYLSQNDMDMVLEAQTSWNRKKYHFSFKPTL